MGDKGIVTDPDFVPEIFQYEAFNGQDGRGLTSALKALQKLSRLNELAQRGARGADGCVGDDVILSELATAIYCATLHIEGMWTKPLDNLDGPAEGTPD